MTTTALSAACLLCGSTTSRDVLLFDRPDQYEAAVGVTGEGYDRRWVQCGGCGFHYSQFSRDPKVLDTIYSSAYRGGDAGWRKASVEETFRRIVTLPESESETKFRVRWIKERVERIWASGLTPRPSPPYRALDIGGATGIFAYEFQDEHWKSHVIDPDEHGRFIEEKFGIPFRQQMYAPGAFAAPFHLISLIFALEHVSNPRGVLQSVRGDLAPGGLLYVEVPDEAAFHLKPTDDDIFNSCHLWMFGPRSLERLFEESGFDIYAFERTQTRRGHYALMALAGRRP